MGSNCTHVATSRIRAAKIAVFSNDQEEGGGAKSTALHPMEGWNPLRLAKLLKLKDRMLAERVGFGPTFTRVC